MSSNAHPSNAVVPFRTEASVSGLLLAYLAASAVAIFAFTAAAFLRGIEDGAMFVAVSSAIVAATIALVWLHRTWAIVPGEEANFGATQVTPLRAVAYLFVPFYNLYWAFVAIVGLADAVARSLRTLGSKARAPRKLAVVVCMFVLTVHVMLTMLVLTPILLAGVLFLQTSLVALFMFGMESAVRDLKGDLARRKRRLASA